MKYWSGNRFVDLMRNGLTDVETKGGDFAYYLDVERPTKDCGKVYTGNAKLAVRYKA